MGILLEKIMKPTSIHITPLPSSVPANQALLWDVV